MDARAFLRRQGLHPGRHPKWGPQTNSPFNAGCSETQWSEKCVQFGRNYYLQMGIVLAGLHAAFEEIKELLARRSIAVNERTLASGCSKERGALSELGDAQVVNAADREER